jgi:PhnB protein
MMLVLADPDAALERAIRAGAKVEGNVGHQHGWRIGRVVDPYGHHRDVGKPLHP